MNARLSLITMCSLLAFVSVTGVRAVAAANPVSALRAQTPPALPTAPREASLVGKEAPAFSLPDTAGTMRTLADYKGKIVILEWVDPDCPYVQRHYKNGTMTDAYKALKTLDRTVVWLTINSTRATSPQQNKFFATQYKLPYPLLSDDGGKIARAYDVRRAPQAYVIDREGIVRYQGAVDNDKLGHLPKDDVVNYVKQAAAELIGDEVVTQASVRPYGCQIKY